MVLCLRGPIFEVKSIVINHGTCKYIWTDIYKDFFFFFFEETYIKILTLNQTFILITYIACKLYMQVHTYVETAHAMQITAEHINTKSSYN